MRQRSHRYELYASPRDLPERLRRDRARSLELGPAARQLDCPPELGRVHVVEQEALRSGGERLLDVGERPALDLDREIRRPAFERPSGRLSDPARERSMVLLYEHGVPEPHAVIATAP